jgi:hypothetical protein
MMMKTDERRKQARLESLNLLSYVCFDEQGSAVHQGMGRTINVSTDGILLETHDPIEGGRTIELTIGLKDDLVDIRGEVVYSHVNQEKGVRTGIKFVHGDDRTLAVLKQFIKAFHGEKSRG